MKISKFFREYFLFFLACALVLISHILTQTITRPNLFISRQDSSLNLSSKYLERFNLGHKRLISSLLWIATILESDEVHYKTRDLNSWMFLRFDTISNLEPSFLLSYTFGGTYLSIIKDDLEGASIIYDKGLKLYPENSELLSEAAFHYQFELSDYVKAYPLYSKLKELNKANNTVISQLARIEASKGNLQVAFEVIEERMKGIKDENSPIKNKLKEFLYAIKAEEDLKCLNLSSKKDQCSLNDYLGNRYLYDGKKYVAKLKWIPYRTKKKGTP